MAALHAGPTLVELMDPDKTQTSHCVCYNKKRGKKEAQICNNQISGPNILERDILIHYLRTLRVSDNSETNVTFRIATSHDSRDVHTKLKRISEILVCKRRHSEISATIYNTWSKELKVLQEPECSKEDLKIDGSQNDWSIKNREQANHDEEKINTMQIEARNSARVAGIIEGLSKAHGTIETVTSLMLDLSQAYTVVQDLLEAQDAIQAAKSLIQDLIPMSTRLPQDEVKPKSLERKDQRYTWDNTSTLQTTTPSTNRLTSLDNETPESALSSLWSQATYLGSSTPTTSPVSQRRRDINTLPDSPILPKSTTTAGDSSLLETTLNETVIEAGISENSVGKMQHVAHGRVTRKTTLELTRGFLPPEPQLPTFRPFSWKSRKEILNDLKRKIETRILTNEKAPGYVYGFQRDSTDYIKIGFTTKEELGKRIKEWSTMCHQELKVVFGEYLPHAGKVERLIHRILREERRREVRVNGLCNAGKGCPTMHDEWFEVSIEVAKNVIVILKTWIESKPYDEEGRLKEVWRRHIKTVATKSLLEPWRDWFDVTILKKETTVKVKLEVEKDDKTLTLVTNQETETIVTQADDTVIKIESTISTAEIKQEPSGEEQALIMDGQAINMKYQQGIVEAKDNILEPKPIVAEYQVATPNGALDLGDPFRETVTA